MKLCLIIFLVLFSITLAAQDYQNICSPGITFYRDVSGNLKGFRFDSTRLTVNKDTIFQPFLTVRSIPGQAWVDTAGGTILGKRVIRQQNGWFTFINQDMDTIRINTQALVNDAWKFIQLPASQYIQARIIAHASDTIMGIPDSVKILELQAFDSLANPVVHPCNHLQFTISRHYGLTKTYNLFMFPAISAAYTLAGKTAQKVGVQPLSMRQVYDFSTGDEFHYSHYIKTLDYHGDLSDAHYIWRILERDMAADSSSVTYTIRQCYQEVYNTFPDPVSHTIVSEDTLSVTCNFAELEEQYWFNLLPDEFACIRKEPAIRYANSYTAKIASYSGVERELRNMRLNAYVSVSETGNLWVPWDTAFYYPDTRWVCFASGIGQVSSTEYAYLGYTNNLNLVYYRKGSVTWGLPVDVSCSGSSGIGEPANASIPVITIFPNPVENQAKIFVSGVLTDENSRLILYDCLGNELYSQVIHSNPSMFTRDNLKNGLYLLVCQDKNGKIKATSKIVIQ